MSWILTHTGNRFDLLEPEAEMIDPRDIAHSLANLCRFNGHTHEFYSVAQHSCMVADLVPDEHKLAALLHDATKAYLGDMTRPLKDWIPHIRGFEDVIWERICERFNLAIDLPACIHQADLTALATERRDLMSTDPYIWDCLIGIDPMTETILPWSATEARLTFHRRLMDQLIIEHRRKAA